MTHGILDHLSDAGDRVASLHRRAHFELEFVPGIVLDLAVSHHTGIMCDHDLAGAVMPIPRGAYRDPVIAGHDEALVLAPEVLADVITNRPPGRQKPTPGIAVNFLPVSSLNAISLPFSWSVRMGQWKYGAHGTANGTLFSCFARA